MLQSLPAVCAVRPSSWRATSAFKQFGGPERSRRSALSADSCVNSPLSRAKTCCSSCGKTEPSAWFDRRSSTLTSTHYVRHSQRLAIASHCELPRDMFVRILAEAVCLDGEDRPRKILRAYEDRGEDVILDFLEAAWRRGEASEIDEADGKDASHD